MVNDERMFLIANLIKKEVHYLGVYVWLESFTLGL
jgi:hypothetical protein